MVALDKWSVCRHTLQMRTNGCSRAQNLTCASVGQMSAAPPLLNCNTLRSWSNTSRSSLICHLYASFFLPALWHARHNCTIEHWMMVTLITCLQGNCAMFESLPPDAHSRGETVLKDHWHRLQIEFNHGSLSPPPTWLLLGSHPFETGVRQATWVNIDLSTCAIDQLAIRMAERFWKYLWSDKFKTSATSWCDKFKTPLLVWRKLRLRCVSAAPWCCHEFSGLHNQTYFNKRGDDDSIPTKGNFLIPSTISISPATSLPFRICAVFSGCLKEKRMKIWIGHFPNNPRSHCLAICPSNPSLTRTYSFYPFSIPLLIFRRNIFSSFSDSLSICFVSTLLH